MGILGAVVLFCLRDMRARAAPLPLVPGGAAWLVS